MFTYSEIDPIALQLGPLAVRWYGLMYVIGILGGWWLGRVQARRPWSKLTEQQVDDMVTWIALGVILGGRVGSVLFYNFGDFIGDPLMLFRIWEGGMSFHGGFLGVLLAMWLYGRRIGVGFWNLTDFIAPLVTIGLVPAESVISSMASSGARSRTCPGLSWSMGRRGMLRSSTKPYSKGWCYS
jgi:phosphatidylglycerol:prolipoprotein diacylglycerol transferase